MKTPQHCRINKWIDEVMVPENTQNRRKMYAFFDVFVEEKVGEIYVAKKFKTKHQANASQLR